MTGDNRAHDFSVSTSFKDGISPTRTSMIVSCVSSVGSVWARTLDDLTEQAAGKSTRSMIRTRDWIRTYSPTSWGRSLGMVEMDRRWPNLAVRVRLLPDNLRSSLPPRTSTMASTSQQTTGQDDALSTLDVFIQGLSLAKDTCGIPPAQIALGSALLLLTMIRVYFPHMLRRQISDSHCLGHHGQ